jgi:hypothetical protein
MLEHGLFERRRLVLVAKLGVRAGDVSRLLFLAQLPTELLAILNPPLALAIQPKSGGYPVAGSTLGAWKGRSVGAILSLT